MYFGLLVIINFYKFKLNGQLEKKIGKSQWLNISYKWWKLYKFKLKYFEVFNRYTTHWPIKFRERLNYITILSIFKYFTSLRMMKNLMTRLYELKVKYFEVFRWYTTHWLIKFRERLLHLGFVHLQSYSSINLIRNILKCLNTLTNQISSIIVPPRCKFCYFFLFRLSSCSFNLHIFHIIFLSYACWLHLTRQS